MGESWEEKYVDKHVDKAWMELRIELADRFAAGLAREAMEPLDISTVTGETLTVTLDDDQVVVVAGDEVFASDNVDEAAHHVFRVLYDDWQVVHPVFLDTEVVQVPSIGDNPIGPARGPVPVLGVARSRDELQEWVEATFRETCVGELHVSPEGHIPWSSKRGEPVVVTVRSASRIDIWTVVARRVGLKKARKVMAELSAKYGGVKFVLRQDTLIMTRALVARPFVPDHLRSALRDFQRVSDRLGGVAAAVLRKRVKVEQDQVKAAEQARVAAEQAQSAAEKAADAAVQKAAEAARRAERRKMERDWVSRRLKRTSQERDAAQAELAQLKEMLSRALGEQGKPRSDRGGEVA